MQDLVLGYRVGAHDAALSYDAAPATKNRVPCYACSLELYSIKPSMNGWESILMIMMVYSQKWPTPRLTPAVYVEMYRLVVIEHLSNIDEMSRKVAKTPRKVSTSRHIDPKNGPKTPQNTRFLINIATVIIITNHLLEKVSQILFSLQNYHIMTRKVSKKPFKRFYK